ncbi:MAG: sugar phosphate isomerase/epimerase, partial [Clostridia bacterium]|nr:sugar phosphate isomerase/epimerase [Clostridia bacterium]
MKKFPIGIQVYSVRKEASEDFAGTLSKIRDFGYDGVEFAGLYGNTPAEVRAICEKYSLNPISAHGPYVDMLKDPAGVL